MNNKVAKDTTACSNYNCEMYRFNKCTRAIRHKKAITNRETFVYYIPRRSNSSKCELYLPIK